MFVRQTKEWLTRRISVLDFVAADVLMLESPQLKGANKDSSIIAVIKSGTVVYSNGPCYRRVSNHKAGSCNNAL